MDNSNQNFIEKTKGFFMKHFSVNTLILVIILIAATLLRFHKLTFQSLWNDEITTLIDADPNLTWGQLFESIRGYEGVHPPLFFIFERYFAFLFGYSDWGARALCALAGITSVWAIFLLGKEIKDEKLGLTASALMCVNYFCIYFSQEARMYSFLLLFTTLSYLFFLKVCKYIKVTDAILFILFTTFLIYTHYFGFFVLISQCAIAIFFLIQEQKHKKKLFIILFTSELLIFIAYIPWLPHLMFAGTINKSWQEPLKPDFFIDYFNEFFGSSPVLNWIVLAFIIIYLIKVIFNIIGFKNLKANPLNLSFIIVIISLIISVGIPYIRSVLVVPMLVSRYTIIVLPSIIIAFAYGIELIPYKIIRYSLLLIFIFLSLNHLIFEKKYYRVPKKTQFRELTSFVTSNHQNYPIINEVTASQQNYYLKKDNYKGELFTGKKESLIDSILQKSSPKYTFDTFWLVCIFVDNPLDAQKQKDLDTAYMIIKDSTFFDGYAQLYVSNKSIVKTIDYSYFNPELFFGYKEKAIPIWSKDIVSRPISLPKGKYRIAVLSYGTPVNGTFPHNNIYINGNKIGDFISNATRLHTVYFEQKQDTTLYIKIDMDNDAMTKDEDRNTFIRRIYILKAE